MSWKEILKKDVEKIDPITAVGAAAKIGSAGKSLYGLFRNKLATEKNMPIEQADQKAKEIETQFVKKQVVKGDGFMNRGGIEVMAKHLVIAGSDNNITGYVLESITLKDWRHPKRGRKKSTDNKINVVAPINVKINDGGKDNQINIERIPMEDFVSRMIRDKGW